MKQSTDQSVITHEGPGCDKMKNSKNFVKGQPLFDLQAEVSRFRCLIFHRFAYFLKI